MLVFSPLSLGAVNVQNKPKGRSPGKMKGKTNGGHIGKVLLNIWITILILI